MHENERAPEADPELCALEVRVLGDPVLRRRAVEIDDIDGEVAAVAAGMAAAMERSDGIGLAAPQVGIERRLFVIAGADGAHAIINPLIGGSDGECEFEEGCLSLPGMSFSVVRPERCQMTGWTLDGNEISVEADGLLARVLLHEVDHLDGLLAIDRLAKDERENALRQWAELNASAATEPISRGMHEKGRT